MQRQAFATNALSIGRQHALCIYFKPSHVANRLHCTLSVHVCVGVCACIKTSEQYAALSFVKLPAQLGSVLHLMAALSPAKHSVSLLLTSAIYLMRRCVCICNDMLRGEMRGGPCALATALARRPVGHEESPRQQSTPRVLRKHACHK